MKTDTISGLVMAGGKSSRMGRDKSHLIYGEEEQYKVVFQLLHSVCYEVFISGRADQIFSIPHIHDQIVFGDIGPLAGLLSAYSHKKSAYMVLGVDYPYVQKGDLEKLLIERDSNALATVYINDNGFYEPLIALYEDAFFPVLINAFKNGITSLQQILQSNRIKKVHPHTEIALKSVDTPNDFEEIIHQFKHGKH